MSATAMIASVPAIGANAAGAAGPIVGWIQENSEPLVQGAVYVVVILVLAVVARAVAGRLVTHLVRRLVASRERLRNAKGIGKVTGQPDDTAVARQQARAETIGSVLRSLASFVIYGVAFIMILGEVGINLGPILASAGVLGLAVAFGAQGLVQDFLSGLFMMMEDQYGVGDVVDVGEAVGTVEEVGLRITKIRDLNGGLWYIRNGEIMRVCNMNQDWANAVVDLPLSSSGDLSAATEVIERSARQFAEQDEYRGSLMEGPDVNGVVEIGNGAVTVRTIAKTRPGEQWATGRALRAHLKEALDREGVEVAHPLRLDGSTVPTS